MKSSVSNFYTGWRGWSILRKKFLIFVVTLVIILALADRFNVHFSISVRKAVSSQNGKTIILKTNLISSTFLSFAPIIRGSTTALQGCHPLCSPAVLQLREKILEFCQPGKNLPTNVNQFIQPLPQVLHVGGVDPTVFIGGFGILV